ncbi:hypothetical protein PQ465_11085 [Sphingobacterium oryzagri]|uniref:Dienelactone hydrolase n=1 Tax=Sphingobacterium oryzagri TaxID=3025669 RepID=A0ABY7WE13_9SPHI|nr:hypothetical protein [Sphingobacterium sp. KACC 22765]WDF66849.1 hypothetical protein PQ465_11085 [Sphingobacterium sp. KACC 22765]
MKTKIILFMLGSFIAILHACNIEDDYKQISHKEYLETHQYNIGQMTLLLNDDKRNRPIKTEIWYPTNDTAKSNPTSEYPFKLPPTSKDAAIVSNKHPLIFLSHGTGGNRISQMWLACELASSGYIVAAVDHFGNTLDNKIAENFVKIWERPLDISFAIDKVVNLPELSSNIDTTKIGMVGFSLGGYTTIALAGGSINYDSLKKFSSTKEGKEEFKVPELGDVSKFITPELIEKGNNAFKHLKDNRISAFVAMAPAVGQGFEQVSQFDNFDKPILIIGAEKDERTPVITNAKHFHNLIKGSAYIELEGKIGHYIFMNEAREGLKRDAPMIFKDDDAVNRKDVHDRVSKIIIDFFEKKLK